MTWSIQGKVSPQICGSLSAYGTVSSIIIIVEIVSLLYGMTCTLDENKTFQSELLYFYVLLFFIILGNFLGIQISKQLLDCIESDPFTNLAISFAALWRYNKLNLTSRNTYRSCDFSFVFISLLLNPMSCTNTRQSEKAR